MLMAGSTELPVVAGYTALYAWFCPSLCDKTLPFVTLWNTKPLETRKEANT